MIKHSDGIPESCAKPSFISRSKPLLWRVHHKVVVSHKSFSLWYLEGFTGGSAVKKLLAMQETQETRVWSVGQEDPLEEGVATHSSILAWRNPWTEEPGELWCIGSQSGKWVSTHACMVLGGVVYLNVPFQIFREDFLQWHFLSSHISDLRGLHTQCYSLDPTQTFHLECQPFGSFKLYPMEGEGSVTMADECQIRKKGTLRAKLQ